ncbi:MAG: hypothetical protein KGJ90_05210 [Patescibacteria group bacterium]|nr:hypothetical protein [Patescibacteria group bacterium]MDE2233478.1 hypothetical protein [Patescibacteria group bacterium]
MQGEGGNQINELQNSLYSRGSPDVRTRRKFRFGDNVSGIKTGWDRPPEEPIKPVLNREYEDHSMSFFTKLLIGSAIFCVIAVSIGAYLFFNGSNLISADNIDITISGPVSIPGGTPVSFDITVTNKNSVDLQLVDLAVNFPAGATDPQNPGTALTTYRELLGDIPSGASVHRTVQAIIFGEENLQKQITADLTYQIKGSSSSFTKEQTYAVLINSSPVNLTVTSFKEITSGQEFDMKVDVKSNTSDILKNVLVAASYPFGYTFVSSDLKPLPDNATWSLGDLPPGAEKIFTIHGKLEGENTDTRVFRFNVGARSNTDHSVIGTEFVSAEQDIAIQKPFMTVGISIDGDQSAAPATGSFNQPVRVDVSWFNNLPDAVSDAQITLKLSGTAYDRTLVQPGQGYYNSATDQIIWNQQTVPQLASVGAGESGTVSFSITPRDLSLSGQPVVNPTLSFSAAVTGKRTQETGVPESLNSIAARTVRISTVPTLSGRVARTIGPFVNTGPIPPKADQQTTYTVIWTIDNTTNIIDNAQVTATLPPYVTWTGNFSPQTEDVSFSSSTNSVVWNAGTVGTYTVGNGTRKELDFQVSVQPNVNQVNSIPTIVNDAAMTAMDDFTGQKLTATQSYLTTRFSTDPSYKNGMETVVR